MITEKQKRKLRSELIELKENLQKTEKETNLKDAPRDEVGELSMYDNHPGDLGTELFEREKDMALNDHANSELNKVLDALQAIDDGSYGTCQECGVEIPYERLEALPYTSYCIEHADKDIPQDRPAEEDTLIMANPDTFAYRRREGVRDGQDSFQDIAKSGTSETPSDFFGDREDYNTLYDDTQAELAEEIEEFITTDIEGKPDGFVHNETTEEYEAELDEEGLESPIGDIPYRLRDSYVDEDK